MVSVPHPARLVTPDRPKQLQADFFKNQPQRASIDVSTLPLIG